jgi:hypothetical protein
MLPELHPQTPHTRRQTRGCRGVIALSFPMVGETSPPVRAVRSGPWTICAPAHMSHHLNPAFLSVIEITCDKFGIGSGIYVGRATGTVYSYKTGSIKTNDKKNEVKEQHHLKLRTVRCPVQYCNLYTTHPKDERCDLRLVDDDTATTVRRRFFVPVLHHCPTTTAGGGPCGMLCCSYTDSR